MDIRRIADEMKEDPVPVPPVGFQSGVYFLELGDGTPEQNPHLNEAVKFYQQIMWRVGLFENPIDGLYDERTRIAVKAIRDRKEGKAIDYLQSHWMFRRLIQWEIENRELGGNQIGS